METVKDVQVETRPGAGTGGGAAGGGGDKVWTITGRLLVRESEVDGDSHDRPLKGIEVRVAASDIGGDGPWTDWGAVRTDADGDFSLAETNNGRTRFFRVQARLNSADLEVEDGTVEDIGSLDVLDRNWRTIWKSNGQLDGPTVSLGTKVVASGQPFELGDATFRRSALVWYVLRAAIDRLEAEDDWFGPTTSEIKAIYPAHGGLGKSWNGTNGRLYLHRDEPDAWHPDVVLYRFMLEWHDQHTYGGRALADYPNTEFAHGFARFGANAVMHELWSTPLEVPLNRRAVARGLALSTLAEVEGSEEGVRNALRVLRGDQREGWWSHLFGTALAYPDNRADTEAPGTPDHPDEVGVKHRLDGRRVPAGPNHLSLWDILRTFRANPAKGWNTDLDTSDRDSSVLRFIDRAVDIHELGDDVRSMLRDCIDPLGTEEPYDRLPKT